MSNDTFRFKQFAVCHSHCAMKVGTDGVLLGAWASGGSRILDIGTGSGLVALMMAQRFPSARVDGVELVAEAAEQARSNVAQSPWPHRVSVFQGAIQDYTASPYDAIVCNPPFFVSDLKNPDKQRSIARHADTLSYRDLWTAASRLLTAEGHFSVIIPFDCKDDFIADGALHGFLPQRLVAIRTVPRKPVKRYLMEFGKYQTNLATEEQLLCDSNGGRSPWYEGLTGAFYL